MDGGHDNLDNSGFWAVQPEPEVLLTTLDIALSVGYAIDARIRAAEIRLISMELCEQTALLRKRVAETRQQSRSLRDSVP